MTGLAVGGSHDRIVLMGGERRVGEGETAKKQQRAT